MSVERSLANRRQEQTVFGKILDSWASLGEHRRPSSGTLTGILDEYESRRRPIVKKMSDGDDVHLAKERIWLTGPAIDKGSPKLFPAATASVWIEKGVLKACIRAVLIATDRRSWGWRFDLAEYGLDGTLQPRPFPHAQQIQRWFMSNTPCLLHPHPDVENEEACAQDGDAEPPLRLNATFPAFPLRGHTLPGLAMAFVVALNGTEIGRQVLDSGTSIFGGAGRYVRQDVEDVLGSAPDRAS